MQAAHYDTLQEYEPYESDLQWLIAMYRIDSWIINTHIQYADNSWQCMSQYFAWDIRIRRYFYVYCILYYFNTSISMCVCMCVCVYAQEMYSSER